jgi:hypothetical protein
MTSHNRIRQTRTILSWVFGELTDVISWWFPEVLWFAGSLAVAFLFGWFPLAIPAFVVVLKVAFEVYRFHDQNRAVVLADYIARKRQEAEAAAAAEATAEDDVVDADLVDADDEERVR